MSLTRESSVREETYDSSHVMIETPSNSPRRKSNGKRACFFCLDPHHLISDCRAWKQKVAASPHRSVALVNTLCGVDDAATVTREYQPFLPDSIVSHSSDSEGKSVKILRDTGSVQSLIQKELLPSLSNYLAPCHF